MPTRALLIGLDGATFDRIDRFVEDGDLPNLAALIAGGTRAVLRSTVPPVTFPAWSTILTGRSPDRHGLVDFTILDPVSRTLRFASAADRHGPTIARLVSDAGGRVAMIGFPTTYPPEAATTASSSVASTRRSRAGSGATSFGRKARWPSRRARVRPVPDHRHRRDAQARRVAPPGAGAAAADGRPTVGDRVAPARARAVGPVRRPLRRGRHGLPSLLGDLRRAFAAAPRGPRAPLRKRDPAGLPCAGPGGRGAGRRGRAGRGLLRGQRPRLRRDVGPGRLPEPLPRRVRPVPDRRADRALARAVGGTRTAGLFLTPPAVQSLVFRRARNLANRLEAAARFGAVDLDRSRAWSEELPYYPAVRVMTGFGSGCDEVACALAEMRDPVGRRADLRTRLPPRGGGGAARSRTCIRT